MNLKRLIKVADSATITRRDITKAFEKLELNPDFTLVIELNKKILSPDEEAYISHITAFFSTKLNSYEVDWCLKRALECYVSQDSGIYKDWREIVKYLSEIVESAGGATLTFIRRPVAILSSYSGIDVRKRNK